MYAYRATIVGNECLVCGAQFGVLERHPASVEFVNGYPVPCRNIGRWIYEPRVEGLQYPWAKSVVKYEPVEIETHEPLWMK